MRPVEELLFPLLFVLVFLALGLWQLLRPRQVQNFYIRVTKWQMRQPGLPKSLLELDLRWAQSPAFISWTRFCGGMFILVSLFLLAQMIIYGE